MARSGGESESPSSACCRAASTGASPATSQTATSAPRSLALAWPQTSAEAQSRNQTGPPGSASGQKHGDHRETRWLTPGGIDRRQRANRSR